MSAVFLSVQSTPTLYLTTINSKAIYVKHDYLNHEEVSGNKLRKLKYSLQEALKTNQVLLSYGGAYSNHIAALAAAGRCLNLKTVGIIRGEELQDPIKWSETLLKAQNDGMKLHFVSRKAYKEKGRYPHVDIQNIIELYHGVMIIPEGGSNQLSVIGSTEIVDELSEQLVLSTVFAACGTGGTLAGIIEGVHQNKLKCKVIGIPVLNNYEQVRETITALSGHQELVPWQLKNDYTFGGYAKLSDELRGFMKEFESEYKVPLDPVYTAKLFYAVFDLARKSLSCVPENWVIYHSGGLQGCSSSHEII